jgi:glycerophosphoryl diester phosphodiesterase
MDELTSQKPAGGASRDRTDDLKLAKLALSQLSYGPVSERVSEVVGLGRLELPTSRLSSARSNQLSYKPMTVADNDQRAVHAKVALADSLSRRP